MYQKRLPICSSVAEKTHTRCFWQTGPRLWDIRRAMAAFYFPDRAAVGLPEQQRDLHKAKLLIASLRGGSS